MPEFDDAATTPAPVEDVWKLLYDPARFPEWWQGVETVEPHGHDGRGDFTLYPAGYPDFPMPQELRSDAAGGRVTVSCMVSDLIFAWRLGPLPGSDGTEITVHVELPEREAHRLEGQREIVRASLRALADLAAASTA
jgi:Polyketide cyclase / dehydrase and lipid transport